jgi:hypothetical protein
MLGVTGRADKTFVLTILGKSAMTVSKMNKMRQPDRAKTISTLENPNRPVSRRQIGSDRAMTQIRRKILRKLLGRIEAEGLFCALPKKSGDASNPPEL